MNDEINKLLREKGHWERRIVELGGPNYGKIAPRATDSEGHLLDGATGRGQGYRYFGAAKNLPGVKELFEKEAPRMVRRGGGGGEEAGRGDAAPRTAAAGSSCPPLTPPLKHQLAACRTPPLCTPHPHHAPYRSPRTLAGAPHAR